MRSRDLQWWAAPRSARCSRARPRGAAIRWRPPRRKRCGRWNDHDPGTEEAMHALTRILLRGLACMGLLTMFMLPDARAVTLEVFHADSLAGPMRELKRAFETNHPGVTLNLTSGVSRDLAARILKGDVCDIFAPSSPAVIDQDLMGKTIAGTDREAAAWYVVFSANEMAIITAKGNPLGIRQVSDLARPQVKLARVTGEKDLATGRTIEFLKRAAAQEGRPEVVQVILDGAPADPARPTSVPDTVNAVKDGKANAGIVYYSAAVAARNDVDIVQFPDSVNLS